jgi:hypothetical protein
MPLEPFKDAAPASAIRNLSCPEYVQWAVEQRGILLIDTRSGRQCMLTYPQAAVWDLLSRGHDVPAVIDLITAIASLDLEAAAKLVHDCLEAWVRRGFLEGEA